LIQLKKIIDCRSEAKETPRSSSKFKGKSPKDKGSSSKRQRQPSSSSEGNDLSTISPPATPPCQEEKIVKISKEKQKFFRASYAAEHQPSNGRNKVSPQKATSPQSSPSTKVFSESLKATPDTTKDLRDSFKAPGNGPIKNLFDGLSHMFLAPSFTRRRSNIPNYSLTQRKKISSLSDDQDSSSPSKSSPPSSPEPKSRKIKSLPETKKEERLPIESSPVFKKSPPVAEKPKTLPMSPSKLIKTAVKSKKLEQERRKELRRDVSFMDSESTDLVKLKKRKKKKQEQSAGW